MGKLVLFVLLALLSCINLQAQNDTAQLVHTQSHLRMSLITCGPGDEIWEVFGHTCIRVIDSTRTDSFRDAVFNYGTFDYNHANFFVNVVKGTLPYYLGVLPFSFFKQIFADRKRSMYESEFLLDDGQKERVLSYLKTNSLPQNREYKYDFLVNNCATCIRDIFPTVFGNALVYGNAMPSDKKVTFRDISDQYAFRKPFERFGVYIFLGSTMDQVIDNNEIMFIPDYLSKAMTGATINGKKVVTAPVQILPGEDPEPCWLNVSFLFCAIIAAPAVAGLTIKKWRKTGSIAGSFLLIITGLIGCIILFFSMGTDHLCAHYNYNALWALPLNLAVPFLGAKWKARIALPAMMLIVIAVLVHLLRVQVMPLFQLSPLLIALLYIHAVNFRAGKIASAQ